MPDIIGFRRRDGRFIGVEVKAGGDQLRKEQITFLDELKAAGGLSFVAHSFEQFRVSFEKRGLLQDPTATSGGAVPEPGPTAGSATAGDDEPRATAELTSTTGPGPR